MTTIRKFGFIGLTLFMLYCCVRIYQLEVRKADLKEDQIELSHIKYGLFNVDEWKGILANVITKKVQELEVTKANRKEMKKKVEGLLYKVVDEMIVVLREENSRSFLGWKNLVTDIFANPTKIRAGVPRYADQVLDYLSDPRNRDDLKNFIIEKINEMADSTIGRMDYTTYAKILIKYDVPNKDAALATIAAQQAQVKGQELMYFILLAFACLGLGAMIYLDAGYGALELGTMVGAASILLITGLSLPMIDIEATISSFAFTLIGEPVEFKDQVLFFQSKSILQVVHLLVMNGGFGLLMVALLVFAFSVLIPFSKLIASLITINRNEAPETALHRFLVFKSSKWSMADVMVVAIFMSYIGFNGVINSQLTEITAFSNSVQVFTTNNSTLQTGFYLFTAYCVIGLLLSALIDRRLERTQFDRKLQRVVLGDEQNKRQAVDDEVLQ